MYRPSASEKEKKKNEILIHNYTIILAHEGRGNTVTLMRLSDNARNYYLDLYSLVCKEVVFYIPNPYG